MSNSSAIRISHLHDFLHAKAHPVLARVAASCRFFALAVGMGIPALPAGTLVMRRALAAFGATLTLAAPASAHDYWADGKPIPNWVKASCCGPPMRITCGPTKCTASSTTITRSTAIIIAFLSHRRCRAGMETTGFSIATIGATGSPESTVSSSRWTSDARPDATTDRDGASHARCWKTHSPRETVAEGLA
jgi:hypothetical protein